MAIVSSSEKVDKLVHVRIQQLILEHKSSLLDVFPSKIEYFHHVSKRKEKYG